MEHRKHGLLMLLGCGFLMVAVFLLLGRGLVAGGGNWAWLLFLICPLMHLLMMRGHSHEECRHGEQKEAAGNSKIRSGETPVE